MPLVGGYALPQWTAPPCDWIAVRESGTNKVYGMGCWGVTAWYVGVRRLR
jgi:hypothetical protein